MIGTNWLLLEHVSDDNYLPINTRSMWTLSTIDGEEFELEIVCQGSFYPTNAPSATPTAAPTSATSNPSPAPSGVTRAPTSAPSTSPTQAPSDSTNGPTADPTE